MRVEQHIQINRPLEEVFSYTSDPQNFPEWSAGAIEVHKDAPGPIEEGGRYTVVSKVLGRRFETPYQRITYGLTSVTDRAVGGPIPDQEWTHTYEEAGGGTYLRWTVEGEPGGFLKLAEPLIQRTLERQFRLDLKTLKDLLEVRG